MIQRRSWWQELVTDNPAIKPSHRSPLKAMNPKSWTTATAISVGLLIVVYVSVTALALQAAQFIDAGLFMYVCLTACLFAPALVLYSSIAGEREKRTIDLLLVAPLTSAQILAAKFMKVVLPVLTTLVLLVIPMIVFTIVRVSKGEPPLISGANIAVAVGGTMLLSLSAAIFVTGMSLWVSSVNKTTAGALTGILAILFLVYIVYAVIAGVMNVVNTQFSDALMYAHPYAVLTWLGSNRSNVESPTVALTVSSLLHVAIGVGLLWLCSGQLEKYRAKAKVGNA